MRTIIKSKQPIVQAWQLGQNSHMEQKMILEGKIRLLEPGRYGVFSQETLGECGELASAGDYFKVDSTGFPYPNAKNYFEANHIHLGGEDYHQLPKPLKAWLLGDPVTEEIEFLLRFKGLQITPERPEECFRAPLWGSILTAAADAVLVIYSLERNESGQILDADFNFVARPEFDLTYRFIEED